VLWNYATINLVNAYGFLAYAKRLGTIIGYTSLHKINALIGDHQPHKLALANDEEDLRAIVKYILPKGLRHYA
jgi:hypothetical protein